MWPGLGRQEGLEGRGEGFSSLRLASFIAPETRLSAHKTAVFWDAKNTFYACSSEFTRLNQYLLVVEHSRTLREKYLSLLLIMILLSQGNHVDQRCCCC